MLVLDMLVVFQLASLISWKNLLSLLVFHSIYWYFNSYSDLFLGFT